MRRRGGSFAESRDFRRRARAGAAVTCDVIARTQYWAATSTDEKVKAAFQECGGLTIVSDNTGAEMKCSLVRRLAVPQPPG